MHRPRAYHTGVHVPDVADVGASGRRQTDRKRRMRRLFAKSSEKTPLTVAPGVPRGSPSPRDATLETSPSLEQKVREDAIEFSRFE